MSEDFDKNNQLSRLKFETQPHNLELLKLYQTECKILRFFCIKCCQSTCLLDSLGNKSLIKLLNDC